VLDGGGDHQRGMAEMNLGHRIVTNGDFVV